MSDFRSEQIEELIRKVRRVCVKSDRCKFEFYVHNEIDPCRSEENQNMQEVLVLFKELEEYGLACEVKNTKKMSREEITRAYNASANWASNPQRPYGISRMIYALFLGGEAGDLFGKEVPAMIIYNSHGKILFVLPHIVKVKKFSLQEYAQNRMGHYQEETTITIYDFLTRLKREFNLKRSNY